MMITRINAVFCFEYCLLLAYLLTWQGKKPVAWNPKYKEIDSIFVGNPVYI